MRVLVTGITGFVGSHLAEYALKMGAEVFGSVRWRSRMENIEGIWERVRLIEADLRDASSARALLGLPIVRARAFNHEGPRRGEPFAPSNFAKQIAEIEAGLREPVVHVGNLDARRDYSDVRDIVRGYWLRLEKGRPGEVYNLCSGRSWVIKEVLDFLLRQAAPAGIVLKQDETRLRLSDVPNLLGDASKIRTEVGWQPEIPFEQTLLDMLDYWRRRLKAEGSRH